MDDNQPAILSIARIALYHFLRGRLPYTRSQGRQNIDANKKLVLLLDYNAPDPLATSRSAIRTTSESYAVPDTIGYTGSTLLGSPYIGDISEIPAADISWYRAGSETVADIFSYLYTIMVNGNADDTSQRQWQNFWSLLLQAIRTLGLRIITRNNPYSRGNYGPTSIARVSDPSQWTIEQFITVIYPNRNTGGNALWIQVNTGSQYRATFDDGTTLHANKLWIYLTADMLLTLQYPVDLPDTAPLPEYITNVNGADTANMTAVLNEDGSLAGVQVPDNLTVLPAIVQNPQGYSTAGIYSTNIVGGYQIVNPATTTPDQVRAAIRSGAPQYN